MFKSRRICMHNSNLVPWLTFHYILYSVAKTPVWVLVFMEDRWKYEGGRFGKFHIVFYISIH